MPGDRVELGIERVAVGGDGIARASDGKIVFVEGALPGERVGVAITSVGRDFDRGTVVEVLEAVTGRRTPPCRYVEAGCGGCGWQFVEPTHQARLKFDIVRDALARQGRLPHASVVSGVGLDPEGYRTTARLGVASDGRVGFRRGSSHDLVHVLDCGVAHPALSELIGALRVPGGDEVTLRVGLASGERTAWARAKHGVPRLVGLPADVQCGPDATVHETVVGQRLRVSAASFFQSSPRSAELLVAAVAAAGGSELAAARRWADLYCGVGLFAATLPTEGEAIAVEQSTSSCRDARVNLAGRAATIVESPVEQWRPESVDVVVADPARSGLGRRGVDVVAATGAAALVLVSCDAAALGRDAQLLSAAGYRHAGSTVLDLFPQTPHVEVVTRFERTAG